MKITWFSFLCCLLTVSVSARNKIHRSPQVVRIEVNTDALSILNSVVWKDHRGINLSGEVTLKRRFGILAHLITDKVSLSNYKSVSIGGSAEFRWYFECDCYSESHVGIYSGIMNNTTITHMHEQYQESFFENGLAGGYKLMLNNSWFIDPSVSLGVSSLLQKRSAETFASVNVPTVEIIMRIMLNAGYRF